LSIWSWLEAAVVEKKAVVVAQVDLEQVLAFQ
jgi:hypothetical protein